MEMNPNHEMSRKMNGQWHKMVALLMNKMGKDHVVISIDEIKAMPSFVGITVQELPDGIHLCLVDEATAHRLARENGGLPH